jgi:SpoVK/Ycf46/Vps4 family AAA+-type ATPase
MTKNERARSDVTALLRARNTLLWIQTREEGRVEAALIESAATAQYETRFWDCSQGLTDEKGQVSGPGQQVADPNAVLAFIRDSRARCVYVLRDLHKWFDPVVLRALRTLARKLQAAPRQEARALVILTPSGEVPPELAGHATLLDWPLPERAEVASILDDAVGALPEEIALTALTNGDRERAIDAALGLSAEEAASCYAKSLVTSRRIDPAIVSAEKRRVIDREKVLTWYEPDPRGMDAVGGLDLLKAWLASRKSALSQRARAFGLPPPKGVMLVGVPGSGKSLTAKAVASAWGLPLLRLDLGAMRSKYVGESEGNIRRALATAEAVSPCVLWLDEIEKSLAGSTGPQGDGGVAADALGAVLSWMQEHEGTVFVVATANDVSALPPELLRKGRFDEVFFTDLPTKIEREAILETTLRRFGRDDSIDIRPIADLMIGFTGAEVAAVVPDALFAAFDEGERVLTTTDLAVAARSIVPLSKTAAEKITKLREWAQGRARPSSSPEVVALTAAGRKLDL